MTDPRQSVVNGWDSLQDAETYLRQFTQEATPYSDDAETLINSMDSLADEIKELLKDYDNDLSAITEGI